MVISRVIIRIIIMEVWLQSGCLCSDYDLCMYAKRYVSAINNKISSSKNIIIILIIVNNIL